ncbi:MAG: SemiSWEET family sugar transporter [Petrotogales bacterium]
MDSTTIEIFGLIAGAITSMGFIPQLVKGYRTKKLEDVSYYMPMVLAVGMSLWFIYGVFLGGLAIIIANAFGIGCCIFLITMKKIYSS